jgi:hypothetical protein
MSDPAEFLRNLTLAMNEHRQSFGQKPAVVTQARKVVQIMLWDNRSMIIDALTLATKLQPWTALYRADRMSSSSPAVSPSPMQISASDEQPDPHTSD